jgi:hypothetical protein
MPHRAKPQSPSPASRYAHEAERVAKRGRSIQRHADGQEAAKDGKPSKRPMQTGEREYPEPPLPKQHLEKPGDEEDLELPPMFEAPHYKGSEKLLDKVALVTGGDSGIGRAVSVLYAREGADITLVYLDEHKDAEDTKRAVEDEGRRCIAIAGCKIACNIDPLTGDIRVQFRPPSDVMCQRPFLWPWRPGRAGGDDWRGQDRRDPTRLF